MVYQKIIIEIAGLKIMEPVASLTDLFVSAVCFYAFSKTVKNNRNGIMYSYFKWHFLTLGIATLFGGLFGHAFLYAFGLAWKLPGWLISMISISLMERAFIAHAVQIVSKRIRFWLKLANNIELLIFMTLTIYNLNFKFVEFHLGFGILAVVFPLQLFMYYKTKDPGCKATFVVVALSTISALIFMNQIILNKWFNHLALSHLIMSFGVLYLYKASTRLIYIPKLP